MAGDADRKRPIVDRAEQRLDVVAQRAAWPVHHLVERRGAPRAGFALSGRWRAGRRRVRLGRQVARWRRARPATMPVDRRTAPALPALISHTVETAGRNTAGDLDPAFWHGGSREFEGEAASIPWARAVWGPLIGEESAR